ncbi:hypothetical protein RE432_04425 [Pusillimonas sp. SM2304]|uniref:hypothetical protein n=1 Tax=Pusillimonas sp. SM2304 TaxID=3073241 RepID=UPI002875D65B|nr:hypothetical protein [Pusillimonas sp. SM2304]MDS1139672.1 hypothetical protein [Pusillimonas sp. SM2304]
MLRVLQHFAPWRLLILFWACYDGELTLRVVFSFGMYFGIRQALPRTGPKHTANPVSYFQVLLQGPLFYVIRVRRFFAQTA